MCVCDNTYLVRVNVEVKVFQESSGKLTEQEVVGLVDGSETPVGVVVGTGASTERPHWTHTHTHTRSMKTQPW